MNKKQIAFAIAAASGILYLVTRMNTTKTSVPTNTTGKTYPNPSERARGYKNNNPLNIRISSTVWQGMIPTSQNGDGSFVQFTTMAYGFRAAMRNIRTSIVQYHTTTVQQIINRWAPPAENKTSNYVTDVCKIAGFQPTTVISPTNMQQMCSLVRAMAFFENGYYCAGIDAIISNAWSLYINSL